MRVVALPACHPSTERDLAIYEPRIVTAFQSYFLDIWESLPPESRNKDHTIERLTETLERVRREAIE